MGMHPFPASDSTIQLCALRYRGSEADLTRGFVVLVAVKQGHAISFYVPPRWQEQISSSDWGYMDDLLHDLVERAHSQPDEVFEQLSNLSVGPIVTDHTRTVDLQALRIDELYPGFCVFG